MYEEIKKYNPEEIIYETCNVSIDQDIRIALNLREFLKYKVVFVGSAVRESKLAIQMAGFDCIEGNYIKHFARTDDYVELLTLPDRDDTVLMYNDYFSHEKYIAKPQLQVWTSIGCPHNCSFCSWRWNFTDGKFVRRKLEHISKEIDYCVDRWKFKSVLFDDDTFNIGDKDTRAIAKMMGKKKLQWSAMVRADSCSLETFKIMKDNGCMGLKVGVETFSPELLKRIDKGLTADDLLERIVKLKDMGFYLYLSTMQYIAGETDEDRAITEMKLQQLYLMGIRYQRPCCVPLPGTKMGKEFQEWELKHYKDPIKNFNYGHYDQSELTGRIIEFSKKKT